MRIENGSELFKGGELGKHYQSLVRDFSLEVPMTVASTLLLGETTVKTAIDNPVGTINEGGVIGE